MMTTDKRGLDRAALEEMLPWHAAGTLSREEAEAVEEALARDPELARRFELVREELSETIHLNESLGAPSARAMDRVLAAIAAEGRVQRVRPGVSLTRRFTGFFEMLSPRAVAWAGAAAALVIVVQAGLIAGLTVGDRSGASLEMASYEEPAGAAAPATFALVRFVPQASAADIARVLEAHRVAIVDGPKPGGLYRVRIADRVLPDDEVGRVLGALQAESVVVGFIAKAQ
jgi:hypothetical protein